MKYTTLINQKGDEIQVREDLVSNYLKNGWQVKKAKDKT